MRKIVPGIAGVVFVVTLGVGLKPVVAQAAKVDCTKVMSELSSGKKARAVAEELKISTSSVYRCRSKARAAAPMASPGPSHGSPSSR